MEEENTGNIAIRVVREMRQGGAVHVVIHIISLKEKKKPYRQVAVESRALEVG